MCPTVSASAMSTAVAAQANGGQGYRSARGLFALAWHSVCAALAAEPFAAFLARFRAHLGLVEKAMGGLLVITGIAFLTGAISEVSYWLLDTFPVLGKIG
jgi:cytochrome c biogenesis protein CcdA